MYKLRHWVLTDKFPAFYDAESATAIEQTAKVYGAFNELVDEYNNFVDVYNQHAEEFEQGMVTDMEAFQVGIRQEFQDFIDTVDLKIKNQDAVIADAVQYMKTNLNNSIKALLTSMSVAGELTVNTTLNTETERLTISLEFE